MRQELGLNSTHPHSVMGSILIQSVKNGAYENTSTVYGKVGIFRPSGLSDLPRMVRVVISLYEADTGNYIDGVDMSTSDGYIPDYPEVAAISYNIFAVPHKWNGTQSIKMKVYVILSEFGSSDAAEALNLETTITLDPISRFAWLTSAPDFTDLDNPTIYYNNPTGGSNAGLMAGIYDTNGVEGFAPYRNVDPYASSYTFNLTDEEREKLRVAAESNGGTLPVLFYLTTWQPGGVNRTTLQRTMTLAGDPPTLDIDLFDINEDAQSAIGNNTKILKGYNYVSYKINATPDDGATIKSYTAKCGDKTLTTQEGYFENVESGDFTFTATDNRGRTKTETKSLSVIDYFKPTINQEVSIDLVDETSARAFIKINGTFYNENFGNKQNQIKVSIRHTDTNGEWIDWIDIKDLIVEIVYDGHNFSADFGVTLPDYTKPYTFQCAVADTLASYAATSEYTVKLIPVFDWSETDFAFNVPVKINGNLEVTGDLTIGGSGGSGDAVIETGTASMGSNGTWYWEKWKSGKAVCYGVRNYGNMAVGTAWGNGSFYSDTFTQNLPSGLFTEAPQVIDISLQGNGTGSAWIAKNTMPTATDTGGFIVMRSTSSTLSQVYISFNIIGRWK